MLGKTNTEVIKQKGGIIQIIKLKVYYIIKTSHGKSCINRNYLLCSVHPMYFEVR